MTDYGRIIVTQHYALGEDEFTAEWEGPDTILISQGLMDQHRDPPFHVEGDQVTICQFKLKLIGRDAHGDYIAQRASESQGDAAR